MTKAEIRDFGDDRTIVVHTEDRSTYDKLRELKSCIRVVTYLLAAKTAKTVGFDLYFPMRAERQLKRALGIPLEPQNKVAPKRRKARAARKKKGPTRHAKPIKRQKTGRSSSKPDPATRTNRLEPKEKVVPKRREASTARPTKSPTHNAKPIKRQKTGRRSSKPDAATRTNRQEGPFPRQLPLF